MDDETRGPQLTSISVLDPAAAWVSAGFAVDDDAIRIGSLHVLTGADVSEPGWSFETNPGMDAMHGIGLTTPTQSKPAEKRNVPYVNGQHANGCVGIDHVVVLSPDLDRTTDVFETAGLPLRRIRDLPKLKRQQRFFWAGDVIIELVGPPIADGDGPASIWGLALVAEDLEAAATRMGELMTTPKPAVQRGRFIAAIKTDTLGLSLTVALMTPHIPEVGPT